MTKYDPDVFLQTFANRLYDKASFTTFLYAALGALIVAGLAAIPASLIYNQQSRVYEEHYRGTGNGFNVQPIQPPMDPSVLCIVGGVH